MKMKCFAIRDRALNAFMQPFFMHTEGQAIRSFGDNVNDKQSQAHAHPDDYDLWLLAEFDDQTGTFYVPTDELDRKGAPTLPRQIAIGKNLKID